MGDDAQAMTAAAQGLMQHPHNPQLLQGFSILQALGVKAAPTLTKDTDLKAVPMFVENVGSIGFMDHQ
jgi:hypothetical protein